MPVKVSAQFVGEPLNVAVEIWRLITCSECIVRVAEVIG